MGKTADVAKALTDRLETFEGIDADRINWPNAGFFRDGAYSTEPPSDGKWVEVFFHIIEPENPNIGRAAPAWRQGWLTMVAVTRPGQGDFGLLRLADDLAALFPLGDDLTHNGQTVRITKTPGPTSPYTDPDTGYRRCSVKARYLNVS